jgi:hypothetical protein
MYKMPWNFDTKEHTILYLEERHFATKSSWNGAVSKPRSMKAHKQYGSKAPLRINFGAKKGKLLGTSSSCITSLEITPDISRQKASEHVLT